MQCKDMKYFHLEHLLFILQIENHPALYVQILNEMALVQLLMRTLQFSFFLLLPVEWLRWEQSTLI